MNADFQLAREGAFCDLAVHGGAGQPGAGQYGFKADNSFKLGHGMFFHSLAVVGTPLDQRLALKISDASALWVPVKVGAHSAALGSERLRTVRNEYGRVWTDGLGEPWRTKNMAGQTVHLRLAINVLVAGAIPVSKGRNLRSIRHCPHLSYHPRESRCCEVQR